MVQSLRKLSGFLGVLTLCFVFVALTSGAEAGYGSRGGVEAGASVSQLETEEEVDVDTVEGVSEPLFSLGATEEEYDPANDEINTAAAISAAQAAQMIQDAANNPNGFVWIRYYMGSERDLESFPNHVYDGVKIQKEFMTVTWFKYGKRMEWDAFPISTGLVNASKSGNFTIIQRMGKYHESSIYHVPMPFALDHNGLQKIHVGTVTGKPESHGCTRVPSYGRGTAEGGKNKGYLLHQVVGKIGLSNVLVTAYRQKPELQSEVHASKILERMNNPKSYNELKFYGF